LRYRGCAVPARQAHLAIDDLVGGAGGPGRRVGDYLVRDGLMLNQVNAGLWFMIRVEPTPQPDLRIFGRATAADVGLYGQAQGL
jgi:hypothetical protein